MNGLTYQLPANSLLYVLAGIHLSSLSCLIYYLRRNKKRAHIGVPFGVQMGPFLYPSGTPFYRTLQGIVTRV